MLGRLLASYPDTREIFEPFNSLGRRGVPHYLPYVGPSSPPAKRAAYGALIDDTLRFRIRGPVAPTDDDPPALQLAKRVLRTNRRDLHYRALRARHLLRPRARTLVKDPIAALLPH